MKAKIKKNRKQAKKSTVWELRSKKNTEINKNIAVFEYSFSYPSQVQSLNGFLTESKNILASFTTSVIADHENHWLSFVVFQTHGYKNRESTKDAGVWGQISLIKLWHQLDQYISLTV